MGRQNQMESPKEVIVEALIWRQQINVLRGLSIDQRDVDKFKWTWLCIEWSGSEVPHEMLNLCPKFPGCFYFFKFLFKKFFYCSIVALQYCVSFYCTAKWISSSIHISLFFGFPSHLCYHRALSRVPLVTYFTAGSH